MAKTKAKEKDAPSKEFSFEKFNDTLSKIDGFEHGSIMRKNTFSKVDHYISTGSYLINAQISGSLRGGLPNSRSVGYVGDPETGKTYMCLNACREAQKMGYYVFYCETEGAVDVDTMTKMGIDVDRIRYQPIKTVNEFKQFTVQVIHMAKDLREAGDPQKFMIVLDSLGMLTTEKEINDAFEVKNAMDMGLKAKQMRQMFRIITLDLAANKIPLLVTNHTTIGGIGSYTGPTKESAGGDGPIFSLSTVLMMSKKFEKVGEGADTKKTGIVIRTRPKKTRSTIPQDATVYVSFASGMNPFVGLEAYVNWDACGIEKGKIFTAKEYAKELEKAKPAELKKLQTGKPFQHIGMEVDEETGEITLDKDGKEKQVVRDLVFVASDTGRWCVKHFGKSLAKGSLLFNKEVFTEDVITQLDENVIKAMFKLPDWIDPEKLDFELDSDDEYKD